MNNNASESHPMLKTLTTPLVASIVLTLPAAAACKSGTRFVKNYGCVPKSVIAQARKKCAKFGEPMSFCICSNDPGKFFACRIID
jgi:hypothetical protein